MNRERERVREVRDRREGTQRERERERVREVRDKKD